MNANPYEAATVQSQEVSCRRSLWRIVPAMFFSLLGIGLDVLDIAVIIQMKNLYARGQYPTLGARTMLHAGVWFGSGVVFIAASVFFWKAKYRRGVYTALAAFAIFAIHAAMNAWF